MSRADLVIQNVVEEARSVSEFFGKPPQQVNRLLLRLAMDERPEWLRGRPALVDLPRYMPGCPHPVKIRSDQTKPKYLGHHIKWIVETLQSEWCISPTGFHFEDENEAVYYRLMWG